MAQLLKFSTQNHRSLRDQQELSFIATSPDDPQLIRVEGLEEAILPVIAIFGANASGKSNVLDAMQFAQDAVLLSQRAWEPDRGIARQPFALGASSEEPSSFTFDFVLESVRYQYGFAVDDRAVVEEWLHAWPHGRKQELYNRDAQTFDFSRNLQGENKAIESLTRPNSLFLSAAAQNNHPQLSAIYSWFSSLRSADAASGPEAAFMSMVTDDWWNQFSSKEQGQEAAARHANARHLLASADLGIEDFRVDEERPVRAYNGLVSHYRRIMFAHKGSDSETKWLNLEQESAGTKALVLLLPELVQVLEVGGVLVIDELSSLHPMLALSIVRLFQDPASNPKGAQLLFSTHETSLLGNLLSDPPPLRRDQVWLTEKDREGASHLYPLTDYKPRTAENLQRGYLQGRYGAVPFLDSIVR